MFSGTASERLVNSQLTLTGKKVRLRTKVLADAVEDYNWRRDAELCQLDACEPISVPFEEYLKYCALTPAFYANSSYLGIDIFEGKHIGNCSYFNTDLANKETELGIMLGEKQYWNQGYGTDAVITLVNHIFSSTKLDRIYLKTLQWNKRAQKCFTRCGFEASSMLQTGKYHFVIMEMQRPKLTP